MMGRISTWFRAHRARILGTILGLLLSGGALAIVIDANGPDSSTSRVTITVGAQHTPPPAGTTIPHGHSLRSIGDPNQPLAPPVVIDRDQTLDAHQAAAERTDDAALGTHEDLRDPTPPGVPAAAAERLNHQQTAPGLTTPQPPAGAQTYTCKYRPVVNQSPRTTKVLLGVLHYTVSHNAPGLGDINAVRSLFNTPSFAASSTYIIDFDGNCYQLMPWSARPWTQLSFNNVSVSVEIIAWGTETRADWLASPLFRRGILAALWRDVLRGNGLPLRRVNPSGCAVQQAGWTDHSSLECGNNHHDVLPHFPSDVFQHQLVAGVEPPTPLTIVEQRIVRGVTAPNGTGHSRRFWCERDRAQRARILHLARTTTTGWDHDRGQRYQLLARAHTKTCP